MARDEAKAESGTGKAGAGAGNVGFVATRLDGTDGVSLEAEKWARVLEKEGCACFYFAGLLNTPAERSMKVEEAHFRHPGILDLHRRCFGSATREPAVTRRIEAFKKTLKERLQEFIRRFDIDLLLVENALAIPMNIPLALALTELIAETGIPTIAHHHDFFWERKRFLVGGVWDYINMAFPPKMPCLHHVVINSSAEHQLCIRAGVSSTVIPNVFDFDNPPASPDGYADDLREAFGLDEDELFILQPTRVVVRKGVEHAIELVHRLGRKARLIISHASGDEGYEYEQRVRQYADLMGVRTLFISHLISDRRGRDAEGRKIYDLGDVYGKADLVTYPSSIEGFGNAFLETIYYRVPIVVNTYSIYTIDIKPKGFRAIEMDDYVTEEAVAKTRELLDDEAAREEMVNHNYELGRKHYSYSVLERRLRGLLSECVGV